MPRSETKITVADATHQRVSLSVDSPRDLTFCRSELVLSADEDTVVEEEAIANWRAIPKSRVTQTARACLGQSSPTAILVAIDNADARRRYADAFRSAGYVAGEASDGLSCLSTLRSEAFDLLVIDQYLLWGSGDGVVEVMQNDPGIAPIPAMLLRFPSPHDWPEGSSSRNHDFGCDELVRIVRQRLAGNL